MSRRFPLIGIGPNLLDLPHRRKAVGAYRKYIEAVERAGGISIILAPHPGHVRFYAELCDGLLLTGGGDIHPKHYGTKPLRTAKLRLSPEERTRFDLALIRAFLRARRPVLGICLGAQTLNIARGGTLVMDLVSQRPKSRDHTKGTHPVRVSAGTALEKILGKQKLRVNSRHHQAVDRPGKNLRVVATADDGVIEALEASDRPFAFGIQWHPELSDTPDARRLFRAFVRNCAKRRAG